MFTFINIFLVIVALAAFVTLVTLPCWKHHSKWWKKIITNLTPYLTWVGVASLGFGPQSLANIVELLFIICCHILMEFLFWILRFKHRKELPTWLPLVITIVFTIALRLLMPIIPE